MSVHATAMAGLLAGKNLERDLAEELLDAILNGAYESEQIADLLKAMAKKGESIDELVGFAKAMRSHAVSIPGNEQLVDTCGTGGSGLATVNTSTLVAFLLAGAGAHVAKHGNRASSGLCGSMDVLEQMGVVIDLSPEDAARILEEQRLAFLFAPLFHPAMKVVGPVRKSLGIRTIFNFLGPLCNPAGVRRQLLGVSDRERAPLMIRALQELGSDRVIVACGRDGLDELSLSAPTDLWILEDGEIREESITPEDLGLQTVPFAAIAGGSCEENRAHFERLLSDQDSESDPRVQHLLFNSAAGLVVAGIADSFQEGLAVARDTRGSGEMQRAFERYRDAGAGSVR